MLDIWPFNYKKEVDYTEFKKNIQPNLLEALNEIRGHFAQKEEFCKQIKTCGYRFQELIDLMEPVLIKDYKSIAFIIKHNRSSSTKFAISSLKNLRAKFPGTALAKAIEIALEMISSNERILTYVMLNLIAQELLVKKLKRESISVIDFAQEFSSKFAEEKELFTKIFASQVQGEKVLQTFTSQPDSGIMLFLRRRAATLLLMVMLSAMAISNTGCDRWDAVQASYSQVEINSSTMEVVIRKVSSDEPYYHSKTRDRSAHWSGEDVITVSFDNPNSHMWITRYSHITFEFKNEHCEYYKNHPAPLKAETKAEMLKQLTNLVGKPVKFTVAKATNLIEGEQLIGLDFSPVQQ